MFKSATFFAALAGTFYFHSGLKKKWQFYDRFYPEPTALQRQLMTESMLFKEQRYV